MADVGVTAPGFVSQAPKLGFVGGFDGVRGIGIMLVLAQHAYPLLFPSVAGIIDVFFVMSAFLIVSLLLQEHRSQNDINMRRFYARRAVRLLPSAYLCILAWIVASLLFDRDRLVGVLQDAAAAVTYVYNFVFPVGIEAVDPQAASERSIDQFWSLAVEEQFYLVIAVTVLVCIRKRWMTQLAVGMVVVASYIGLARLFGQTGPWPGGPTNSSIPARGISLMWLSRPDSLMWGVALAVLNARLPDPLPQRWRVWLPRVGAVGLLVASVTMLLGSPFLEDLSNKVGVPYPFFPMAPHDGVDDGSMYWIKFGHTVTALAAMPALLAMVRAKDWWGNRSLSWKPIRFLGRMSYTLYVWHTLVYFLVLHVLGGDDVLGEKWRVPILMAVTVVACLPVFYGVEQRMLRVKLRFASEKEVLDLNTGKVINVDERR
jgi:peptidoglycan/LPS O-acetylase OafA/YrhL